MKVIGIIPARLKSTRFSEKLIADLCGKPLIQWVYEQAKKTDYLGDVIVAADDQKIIDVVKNFGGKAVLTSKKHKSGSERIAEIAASLEADIIVNIQGDEPLINPLSLDNLITAFYNDKDIKVATLIHPIQNEKDLADPNVVKVVIDKNNFALYFSRARIPCFYPVKSAKGGISPKVKLFNGANKHIGVYAYTKDFLLLFNQLSYSKLEKAEKLEQLRILENGYRIKTVIAESDSVGVDTEKDLKKVKGILLKRIN